MAGPLTGLRVLEFAGLAPSPHGAMILADLGADVVYVGRPGGADPRRDHLLRGRRCIELDLKSEPGREHARKLANLADVLIEPFRPGVMERLGLGPAECTASNPGLIYARMTGWGQGGPLAQRAGHDINYISLTGILNSMGRAGQAPLPPLNLVGDFGGGSTYLVIGILAALFERALSGRGQVLDVAIIDGATSLAQMIWALRAVGRWSDERGVNVLDTGAPFYDTYECADGEYVAVGAIEPQFYAALVAGLGLNAADIPDRDDRNMWPLLREILQNVFATRSRDEWATIFADNDACVTPVLSFAEAAAHPHMAARSTLIDVDGVTQAAPAPRFSRTRATAPVLATATTIGQVEQGWRAVVGAS
jgi:alpha-methylacyl-CoA racemase